MAKIEFNTYDELKTMVTRERARYIISKRIRELQKMNFSASDIAKQLEMSESSVRAYMRKE